MREEPKERLRRRLMYKGIMYISLPVMIVFKIHIYIYADVLQPQNLNQQMQGKPFPALMNQP